MARIAVVLTVALLVACSGSQRANSDLFAGAYARAAEEFEALTAKEPGDVMAWRKLGYARYKSLELRAAISAFEETLRLAPGDPDATFYLGQSLIASGRQREGLEVLAGYAHPDMFFMAQTSAGEAKRLGGTGLPDQVVVEKMERARDVGFARQRLYQAGDKGFGSGQWGRLYLPIRNPAAGDDLI
jgi:predicted Zn-dependent protease